jgi:glycosyl hydrolase family 123
MKPHRALLVAALTVWTTPLIATAAEAWVASATEKIRPNAPARAQGEARVAAARNEFEAFQVVVTGPARQVSARVSGLEGLDAKLSRVEYISLAQPSAADGAPGRWPDALVPDVDEVVGEKRNAFPFDVAAGESRAIWVEVHVPAGAPAGAVKGQVTVTTAAGEAAIPVTVEVRDFELPSTSSLRTSFGLSYGVVAAAHGVSGEADAQLRARYGQLALDHRLSLTGLNDDGYHADMSHFDRFYGPLVEGSAPTRLAGARLTSVKYVGGRTSVDEHAVWAKHAREKGWFDRLFDYTCDEPPLTCAWSDIPARAGAAHQADPEFRTLVTTQLQDAEDHGVAKDIDIVVPVVNWMNDRPGNEFSGDQRPRYDAFLGAGSTHELWLYQSCMSHGCGGTVNIGSPSENDLYFTGWPSYMIDASAARNRAMEWISFLERASGELYWETGNAFRADPWASQWDFSGNGDGTLFYPGTPARIGGQTHIPVASIRVKMIREGMEDYEYLKALSDAGDPELARQIAREVFPNAWSTDVAPEKIEDARARIAARIVELRGGQAPAAAPAAGSPGADAGAVALGAAASPAAGGGCGSAGGLGAGALLALPLLLARVRRRAR